MKFIALISLSLAFAANAKLLSHTPEGDGVFLGGAGDAVQKAVP